MEDAKPEPISMGIIVNFVARTVQGFGSPSFMDYPVKITGINDVTVEFGGSQEFFFWITSSEYPRQHRSRDRRR
jgi:hypothetical protein